MSKTRIFLVTHAPLAHALRACALHVFADCADDVLALDVHPHTAPEETQASARILLEQSGADSVLVLTDVFGATPCNVAQRLIESASMPARLVTGVNLPMLLRAITYREEPLEALAARAVAGGTQGVMQVGSAAPQNQISRSNHDPDHYHHQQ